MQTTIDTRKYKTELFTLLPEEVQKLHGDKGVSVRSAMRRIKKVIDETGIKNRHYITRKEYADYYGYEFSLLESLLI